MQGASDVAGELKKWRGNFWGNFCCCTCPLTILLIVLSSIIGYFNANAKIFYVGFNWPYYPGGEFEGAIYLCGHRYDDIVEDLFEDYYR